MYKFLLMDDEPNVIRDIVLSLGYEVVVAVNGKEGLQILEASSEPFDLVILDIVMPEMDGWAVLREVRKKSKYPHVPILMLTQSDDEFYRIAGLRRGADSFLTKPVTVENLSVHIEALLRRVEWSKKARQPYIEVNNPYQTDLINKLTNREKELLLLVGQGLTNREIGQQLSISERTVKNHLVHILDKLKVSNRTQAALFAKTLADQHEKK